MLTATLYGQGCSDAGFCTLNSLRTEDGLANEQEKSNSIKLGAAFGQADYGISIQSSYLEYTRSFNSQLNLNAKLTYLRQNGSLATSEGLGDVYLSGNYFFRNRLTLTVGFKLPLSDGNKKLDGLSLPMDYQTSLGTYDLILGLGYEIKNFYLSLALQQPLTQNSNTFLISDYPADSDFQNFQSTNEYTRKSDLMLRITYQAKIGERIKLTPGILPIYHIANDEFTDSNGQLKQIEGSQGLTLNGTLFLAFAINENNSLELNYGMPFITREARPDGLTREYMLGVEYKLAF